MLFSLLLDFSTVFTSLKCVLLLFPFPILFYPTSFLETAHMGITFFCAVALVNFTLNFYLQTQFVANFDVHQS